LRDGHDEPFLRFSGQPVTRHTPAMDYQIRGAENKSAPRLLDRLRTAIRTKHYSPKTEEAYVRWARQFVLFQGKRHPIELGKRKSHSFYSISL
jgi:hypothetical protein